MILWIVKCRADGKQYHSSVILIRHRWMPESHNATCVIVTLKLTVCLSGEIKADLEKRWRPGEKNKWILENLIHELYLSKVRVYYPTPLSARIIGISDDCLFLSLGTGKGITQFDYQYKLGICAIIKSQAAALILRISSGGKVIGVCAGEVLRWAGEAIRLKESFLSLNTWRC